MEALALRPGMCQGELQLWRLQGEWHAPVLLVGLQCCVLLVAGCAAAPCLSM